MKRKLLKFAYMMTILLVIIGNSHAQNDFTVSSSTDDSQDLLRPVKAGASATFKVTVKNNLSVKTIVSINTGIMGTVGTWATVDRSNDTIYPAQTKVFNVTIAVPVYISTSNFTFQLSLSAVDINGVNRSYNYRMLTLIVDNTIPDAPYFQTASTSTSIAVYSWSSIDFESGYYTSNNSSSGVNGIEKYIIQLQNLSGGTISDTIAATGSSSKTFSGLPSNSGYKAIVKAVDLAGNSSSTEVNTSTAPAKPVISSPSSGYCNINLSWTASPGATSYELYNATNSPASLILATDATSHTVPGLQAGTQYKFNVKAVSGSGLKSDLSNTLSVSTLSVPTPAFNISQPDMCTSDKVIQINEIPYASSYIWTVSGPLSINGSSSYETAGNSVTVHSNSASGTGNISVVANLSCSFQSNSAIQYIVIGTPAPSITAKKISASGEPTEYQFTATLLSNATYNWYVNNVLKESYLYPNNQFEWYFPANVSRTIKCNITNTCGTSAFSNSITKTGDPARNFNFSVYPNPANLELTISQNNEMILTKEIKTIKSIMIIDGFGTIYTTQKFGNETINARVDISNLKNGTYFLIINEGQESEKQSFIKY